MPIAANTLSSSVSDVHAVSSVASLIGQYDLKTGTNLRPLMPPLALIVVEVDLVRLLLVGFDRVDELRDARVVDHHDADLDLRSR